MLKHPNPDAFAKPLAHHSALNRHAEPCEASEPGRFRQTLRPWVVSWDARIGVWKTPSPARLQSPYFQSSPDPHHYAQKTD
jgi:hypothetical protein